MEPPPPFLGGGELRSENKEINSEIEVKGIHTLSPPLPQHIKIFMICLRSFFNLLILFLVKIFWIFE